MTRRDLLHIMGAGFGMVGFGGVAGAETPANPLLPKSPHFPAKAKRVIYLFLNGGPSQVDTFDPKPKLDEYNGKPIPTGNLRTERKTGNLLKSPFKFKKYGESGLEISEIFPKLGECADDLAIIRSMKAEVPNHEPSLMLMNCGDSVQARPSMGSWITYGLGTENLNLPGFIVMCPGGYPVKETDNWQNGFLPGVYQGTYIDSQHTRIEKLIENIRNNYTSINAQRRQLDLLQKLNQEHQQ